MPNTSVDPRFSIAYMLSKQSSEIPMILAIASCLLSIGFIAGTGNNANYVMIFDFAHRYIWAIIFGTYSAVKFIGMFSKVHSKIKTINGLIGIWAWNYIFLSFTVFDTSPIAPTEMLLLVPVIAEFWTMLAIDSREDKPKTMRGSV